uniref:Plus3 domain-containing protein n=1 Tax=Moniliophthora roreri TaxID=221103 RepID=A0A0W0F0V2_MONRR
MSDFDDELLELVEAGSEKDKKRKRNKSKSSSVSDNDEPESEEEEEIPYPLEGKYVDETDRNRLMQMSEVEREEILAQRAEEMQRIHDKRALSQMVKDQRADGDSVAKAAKRQHTARGATKEKSRKLDELKAKRKAKDEKSKNRTGSPKRDRSSSPMDMDMETSDEDEEEEGMITRAEQEEESLDRKLGNLEHEQPVTMVDFESVRLDRYKLSKHCMAPWFDRYVEGAYVRYLIGNDDDGTPVYRICRIERLNEEPVKPYKIEGVLFDRTVELAYGSSKKAFPLDKVSNGPFQPKEFERMSKTYEQDKVKMPTKSVLETKRARMEHLVSQPLTENDIATIIQRKSQLNANRSTAATHLERSQLQQAKTLALRRQDFKEVAEIEAKLAEFESRNVREGTPNGQDKADVLAMLSEKNRKANAEAVRRAEMMEAERRRRERKLASSGKSGTATPTDPSARLRTIPKIFNVITPASRPGTPSINASPSAKGESSLPAIASPTPAETNGKPKTFEASVIDSVEIDLGDF